jgi:serine protease AprX
MQRHARYSVVRKLPLAAALVVVSAVMALVLGGASWGAGYDPAADPYSMSAITSSTGAQAWWNAGYTGQGIDVAVIDTGVAPVAGLSSSDKLIYGPDLSLESQAPNLTHIDTNGHGTFMAGLIGADQGTGAASSSNSSPTVYRGMAPGARILSIKVATADGGTDVTQVIAAIDWVVQHAHDPGLNIRVINLSYGTNSTQAYTADPLDYAAEQAWKHGIVVVAATGNTGFERGGGASGLADPASDPYVIAVGASDATATVGPKDMRVADFSASASTGSAKSPDLVAPGSHLQGLRVPGSYLDVNHPEGILDGNYFRGSGTSMATAITSGAVALILQRYPQLTPYQVKAYLQANADKIKAAGANQQGAGEIDLASMLGTNPPSGTDPSWYVPATGTGLIEQARGTDHIAHDGVVLSGEQDIFGKHVDTGSLANAEANASSWSGGTWNGSSWSGSSWSSSSWSSSSWSGSSWSSSSWSGSSWSSSSWSSSSWSSSSWSSSSWSSSSWSGSSWSGSSWSSSSWSGSSWS